jgi:hypothetical protein
MKPVRQLEVAELMVSANTYTTSYARALLATTRPEDLHKPDQLRKAALVLPYADADMMQLHLDEISRPV